jgi:hypothetical protein
MLQEIQLIRFDWAIKTLLRDKANFDVLEGFLSALLKEDLKVEQILESESNQEEQTHKYNRVDLLVKDSQNRRLIIEIQNQREADYLERLLFGTSKVIVENLGLGEVYGNLVKVISISILYFNLGTGDDYVYYGTTEFRGLHTGHPLLLRERVEAICDTFTYQQKNVFPDYYLINVERFQDVIESSLDEWIYMLKHNTVREDFKAPKIEKAREKLALLKMSPAERKQYERYVESVVIERDMFETARADGLEEGIAMGIEKGKIEGRVEGYREMLKTLHQHGMSIEQISSVTGLNAIEVQQLLEN